MKAIRFKDKKKKGQVLGLGHVDGEWKTVSESDIAYFEQLNTRVGTDNKVVKRTLDDFGIEVKDVPDPKPENTKKEDEDK